MANAAHITVQECFSDFGRISNVTRVASTRKTGLPHENLVRGKKADLAFTVVRLPTLGGPRIDSHDRVSALCLDVSVVHPCTGKGILEPNKQVDAGKAKITKHGG